MAESGWKLLERLQNAVIDPRVADEEVKEAVDAARERAHVPVIWLLGKTQAGKTSIVRTLTGSSEAEIGNGFQPCTRTARLYDYPTSMASVRFLDTRGLGEQAYDPSEDIAFCEGQSHLVLAVMKVADPAQQPVYEVLRKVRKRHPGWPVLIAQTGLHELYVGQRDHPERYPFDNRGMARPPAISIDLARMLQAQREALGELPGDGAVRWVPIDFTLPEDGFTPPDYGLPALWSAIENVTEHELQRQLLVDPQVRDVFAATAHQHIVGHTLTAAALGAVPAVDLAAVSVVQAKMLHALAKVYGQRWSFDVISEFVGLLGSGVVTGFSARMLGRSIVKFIPGLGQTIGVVWGAATSGATTYALGKAAVYFFARRREGTPVKAAAVRMVYAKALAAGRELIRNRSIEKPEQD